MYNYQALFEQLVPEDFESSVAPRSKSINTKHKAAAYLGKDIDETMNPTDFKRLRAKANKMKKSQNKAIRARGAKLSRQLSWYNNFHN